ncbi:hypothetical protein L596_020020 [Steinernema carpocapsae]|uniref:Uncharacterized protein n=1 Tax=Steinernema carpocapsae TaxID=34508 RepID=A0A4U5MSB1_STECR|nr:hypothetical protein L596_020020 [Steinernema carpocapsae]
MDHLPYGFYRELASNLENDDITKLRSILSVFDSIQPAILNERRMLYVTIFYSDAQNAICASFAQTDTEYSLSEILEEKSLIFFLHDVEIARETCPRYLKHHRIEEKDFPTLVSFLASLRTCEATLKFKNRLPNFYLWVPFLEAFKNHVFEKIELRYHPHPACVDFLLSQLGKQLRYLKLHGNWPSSLAAKINQFVDLAWNNPVFKIGELRLYKTDLRFSFKTFETIMERRERRDKSQYIGAKLNATYMEMFDYFEGLEKKFMWRRRTRES